MSIDQLHVDERGFIWFGDYRLPVRWEPEVKSLEFCARYDKRRGQERGERKIFVPVEDLVKILTPQQSDEQ